jgi:hypothetical protein
VTIELLAGPASLGEIQLPQRGRPTYTWHACDLKTGRRLETFPFRGSPERLLGAAVPVTLTCDLADDSVQGKDFWGTVIPRRTMIVLERQYPDEVTSDIPWVGVVTSLPDRGPQPQVTVGTSTIEEYLARRYVGTHTFNGQPADTDAAIVTALMGDANTEGIGIALDLADLTTTRALRYKQPEHRTVLACLQELSDLEGGPEWTINGAWSGPANLTVALTLFGRPRIGVVSTMPNARFQWPGSVLDYRTASDHSGTKGGNYFIGLGNGQGSSTPKAVANNAADIAVAGRWEVADQVPAARTAADLAAGANAGLARVLNGETVTYLEADATEAPQVGRDWIAGDDIQLVVEAWDPATPRSARSYGHPDGLTAIGRAIGWQLDIDANRITPKLWQPGQDETP